MRPHARPCTRSDPDELLQRAAAWLAGAHRALDAAVAAAYGWPADISDDEVLTRLLALNLERAGTQSVT